MRLELSKTQHVGKLTKKVIEYIIQQVVDDEWPPGMRVIESDLTETLGVSRTTVRAAIGILIGKGELTQTPRGVIVTKLKPKELLDLIEFRKAIEIGAVRLAAIRASQRQRKKLRDIVRHMERHLKQGALLEYIYGNYEFHHQIAEASGNQMFSDIFQSVNLPTVRYRYRALFLQGQSSTALEKYLEIIDEHKVIVEKIDAKDELGAAEAMEMHIENAIQRWTHLYMNRDYSHNTRKSRKN